MHSTWNAFRPTFLTSNPALLLDREGSCRCVLKVCRIYRWGGRGKGPRDPIEVETVLAASPCLSSASPYEEDIGWPRNLGRGEEANDQAFFMSSTRYFWALILTQPKEQPIPGLSKLETRTSPVDKDERSLSVWIASFDERSLFVGFHCDSAAGRECLGHYRGR